MNIEIGQRYNYKNSSWNYIVEVKEIMEGAIYATVLKNLIPKGEGSSHYIPGYYYSSLSLQQLFQGKKSDRRLLRGQDKCTSG
jgi:hypothetical protein